MDRAKPSADRRLLGRLAGDRRGAPAAAAAAGNEGREDRGGDAALTMKFALVPCPLRLAGAPRRHWRGPGRCRSHGTSPGISCSLAEICGVSHLLRGRGTNDAFASCLLRDSVYVSTVSPRSQGRWRNPGPFPALGYGHASTDSG